MGKVFIGGDGGTSGNKVVAVDEEGRVVAEVGPCGDYPIYSPHPGWSEQNLHAIYSAEMVGLKDIVAKLRSLGIQPTDIGAVATTMQMHTSAYFGWSADEVPQMVPVRDHVILWNDARAGEQVQAMIEYFGLPEIIRLVNNRPTTGYSLFHALHVMEHEPEVWAQVRAVSLMNSCFGRWTTGEEKLNWNDAAGTCAYDVANRCWSPEVAAWADIPVEFWPTVVKPEEVIGTTRGLEQATGLPDGVPVIAGLGDCAAGALGCGVVNPGRLCCILGTAGIFVAPTHELICDTAGGGRVQSYGYVGDLSHTLTTNLSAGAMLEGWSEVMAMDMAELDAMAGMVPFGTNQPQIDTRLCGERTGQPGWKPDAKGAILGLDLSCFDPARIWLATLKAIVFNQMLHLWIQLALGVEAQEAVIMGGGTKSPLYTSILVAGLTAVAPNLICRKLASGQGGGARGMAILAGHGAGYIPDLAGVAGNIDYGGPLEPNPAMVALMAEQYQDWFENCYNRQ